MAREYARVRVSIWADSDFRRLSDAAQALYFRLITSPTMNLAGVADWRPKRIAALTAGMTARSVEKAAAELAEHGYVVIDDDTEEALVRSFIRHDGLIKTPNIAAAMVKDYAGTASETLRGVIVHELHRLHDEDPHMKGWSVASKLLTEPRINPSAMPSGNPSGKASPNPSGTESHIPHPASLNQQPASGRPTAPPTAAPAAAAFEEFWSVYPRREKKQTARTAFAKALKMGATPQAIIEGARRYRDDPNRDPAFTAHPTTWLNGGRWEDDPLPPRITRPQDRPRPGVSVWDQPAGGNR